MFLHSAMITFSPDAPETVFETYETTLTSFVGVIPGLVSVTVHHDLGLASRNSSVLLLAVYDDEQAWRSYNDDDRHKALGAAIGGHIVGAAFVQAAV